VHCQTSCLAWGLQIGTGVKVCDMRVVCARLLSVDYSVTVVWSVVLWVAVVCCSRVWKANTTGYIFDSLLVHRRRTPAYCVVYHHSYLPLTPVPLSHIPHPHTYTLSLISTPTGPHTLATTGTPARSHVRRGPSPRDSLQGTARTQCGCPTRAALDPDCSQP
jgi:hypothetical protein